MTFGTDPVGLLCDLIAAPGDSFEAAALPPACQAALAFLERMGAVRVGDLPSVVTCAACDDNHPARLEYDPAARRYRHFCPEAGHVGVADENLAKRCVEGEWLVRWLVQALPIAPDRHRALVPDSIWHLGDAVVGGTEITVVFAERVSTRRDLTALADAVRAVHPAELGLVITTSAAPIPSLSLPNGFLVLDLREIARTKDDQLVMDKPRLAGWVKGYARGRHKPVRDGRGRPSVKHLELEIARERRERKSSLPVQAAEARAIREEIIRRHPEVKPPAESTIAGHLREMKS